MPAETKRCGSVMEDITTDEVCIRLYDKDGLYVHTHYVDRQMSELSNIMRQKHFKADLCRTVRMEVIFYPAPQDA